MTESVLTEKELLHQQEVKKHLPRNYAIHCVEGGLFIGGIAFVGPETLLPKVIESLNGPTWLIAIIPAMMKLGFVVPTLLTAHMVERWPSVKPALLFTGFFQRTVYLVPGLVLWFGAESYPTLALISVALAPLLSGIFGGFTMTAWLELVAKTIPENRRSSVWAIRFIISSVIGICAGGIISTVLSKYPGTPGYAILHFILFGFLMASYAFFSLIHETSSPVERDPGERTNLRGNLKTVPRLIREDRDLRNYLITRSLMNGTYILIPFLPIHALRVLDQPESYLGYLLMSHMVGGIAGNLLAGYLGDKAGGKSAMTASRLAFLTISAWSFLAASEWEFFVIYFLFGAAYFGNQVGTTTLCIELCPPVRRATYLGIMATLTAPTMIVASILSTLVWDRTENFAYLGVATGLAMAVSLYYLAKIDEPRGKIV